MQRVVGVGPRRIPPRQDPDSSQYMTMARMLSPEQIDQGYYEVNIIVPGPDTDEDILCAVGSNRGILQWKGEHYYPLGGSLSWKAPGIHDRLMVDNAFNDIFALDFRRNTRGVIFGGGRPGRCFIADSRVRDLDWLSFRHGTSITHIKSLNEWHLLISGTQHMMRIYDIRMVKGHSRIVSKWKCRTSPGPDADRSITSFPEYTNNAWNKIGLAVDIDAGIVATAHDDGKVAIHSLESGHRLRSPAVDRIQADLDARGPIKVLQFEKMKGDSHSSLFAAVGSHMKMYSLGMSENDDEI
jgi:hypothetical protein